MNGEKSDDDNILKTLSKRELIDAAKEGWKEVFRETMAKLGWFATKTVVVFFLGGAFYLLTYFMPRHGPH